MNFKEVAWLVVLHVRLAFVGGEDLRIAQFAGVDIGTKDIAGFGLLVLLNRLVIRPDVRLALPLDGLEGRVRRGTAFASVAFVFAQRRGLDAVILPARGQRCEGLLRGFGGAQALGL